MRIGSARQRRLLAALAAHLGRSVDVALLGGAGLGATRCRPTRPGRCRPTSPGCAACCPAASGSPPRRTATGWTRTARASTSRRSRTTSPRPATVDDPVARRDRLGAALALWRGGPYPELDHPALAPEVARLAELRAGAASSTRRRCWRRGGRRRRSRSSRRWSRPSRCGRAAVGVLMRALVAARQAGRRARRLRPAPRAGSPTSSASTRRRSCGSSSSGCCVRSCRPRHPGRRRSGRPPHRRPRPRVPLSSFVGRAADLARVVERRARAAGWSRCAVRAGSARRGWPGTSPRRSPTATPTACWSSSSARAEPPTSSPCSPRRCGSATAGPSGAARWPTGSSRCSRSATSCWCSTTASTSATRSPRWSRRSPLPRRGSTCCSPAGSRCGSTASRCCRSRRWSRARRPGCSSTGCRPATPPRHPIRSDELVAEVCRRLDGLPLALELAAARALPLGLPRPARRPGDLGRSRSGSCAADAGPPRRGTAPCATSSRGPTASSTTTQRTLFDRMSVFAGPGGVRRRGRGLRRRRCAARPRRPLARRPAPGGARAVRDARDAARLRPVPLRRRPGRDPAAGPARGVGGPAGRRGDRRRGAAPGSPRPIRRFDAHLADLRRAHAWLCSHGPLDELLRLTVPDRASCPTCGAVPTSSCCSRRPSAPPARSTPTSRCTAGRTRCSRACSATTPTRCGSGATSTLAERQARRALALAAESGDPTSARDGQEALANVLGFRGDLDGRAARGRARLRARRRRRRRRRPGDGPDRPGDAVGLRRATTTRPRGTRPRSPRSSSGPGP